MNTRKEILEAAKAARANGHTVKRGSIGTVPAIGGAADWDDLIACYSGDGRGGYSESKGNFKRTYRAAQEIFITAPA